MEFNLSINPAVLFLPSGVRRTLEDEQQTGQGEHYGGRLITFYGRV